MPRVFSWPMAVVFWGVVMPPGQTSFLSEQMACRGDDPGGHNQGEVAREQVRDQFLHMFQEDIGEGAKHDIAPKVRPGS